ncbi:MAG: 50S ribosomal protein L17 [Parcubacteria group bacterium GW2011_GWB1_43_8]|nr:MAG: 50S ribosomal protein L17 [Parcubacteria group bacterium GW2011_GWB1_43_8]
MFNKEMRHHNTKRKFGRETNQRKALMKSLAVNLIKNDKIKTTEAKAKELRPFIEKLVTKAKGGDLAKRRIVASVIGILSTKKLFDKIAPKYKDRNGGYTRITKMPRRKTDGSKISIIEFV